MHEHTGASTENDTIFHFHAVRVEICKSKGVEVGVLSVPHTRCHLMWMDVGDDSYRPM